MPNEQKNVLNDVLDVLLELQKIVMVDISKYKVHHVSPKKLEDAYNILTQIKYLFSTLEIDIDELEDLLHNMQKNVDSFDLCFASKIWEGDLCSFIRKAIDVVENRINERADNGKRTIRIKYEDFYPEFIPEEHWLYKLLAKKYNVIFSDNPDYLFFSCFGSRYLNYSCIRIFISNEAVYPNFNLYDYAVTYTDFEVSDRLLANKDPFENLKFYSIAQDAEEAEKILEKKTDFCNFVYSNGNGDPYRTELFNAVSKYKRVVSGGKYLNNTGYLIDDLAEFQSRFKFSIACENGSYPGYTTEKIINAFNGQTIPIYWGDELVIKNINPKAIINCNNFSSIDEVVEEIIRIDRDDEAYKEMLCQPILVNCDFLDNYLEKREKFIYHIIDQEYSEAFRRNRTLRGQWYNDWFCFALGYPNEWFSEEKGYFVKRKTGKAENAECKDNNASFMSELLMNINNVLENIPEVSDNVEEILNYRDIFKTVDKFMDDLGLKEAGNVINLDDLTLQDIFEMLKTYKYIIQCKLGMYGIIRRDDIYAGMGSYILTNLMSIYKCLHDSRIPVIDMATENNPFNGMGKVSNGWEIFFEQPCHTRVEDLNNMSNIPVYRITAIEQFDLWENIEDNKKLQKFWNRVYKKYMRFTPEVDSYIKKEQKNFFEGIDVNKVCGVMCRGTDYVNKKPYNHMVQPEVKEVIQKTGEVMERFGCEYVFLATEDMDIYDTFCDSFGRDRIIITKTHMMRYNDDRFISQVLEEDNVDIVQNNLDYLSTLYQLSSLNYFISGNTSGALSVLVMKGGFDYSYIWNKGRYGVDSEEVIQRQERLI